MATIESSWNEWKKVNSNNRDNSNNNNRTLCVTMMMCQHLCGDCCVRFWFSFEPIWPLFRIKYFACLTRQPCNIDNNNGDNDDDDVITSVLRIIHIKNKFLSLHFRDFRIDVVTHFIFLIHLLCLAVVPIQPPCNLCKKKCRFFHCRQITSRLIGVAVSPNCDYDAQFTDDARALT